MYYTTTQFAKGSTNKKRIKREELKINLFVLSPFYKNQNTLFLDTGKNLKSNNGHKTMVKKLENSNLLGISFDVGLSVLKIGSMKCKDCPMLVTLGFLYVVHFASRKPNIKHVL